MRDYYIGLMSGTSLDAIDVVLADCKDRYPILVASHNEPLSDPMRDEILALCEPCENELERMMSLDVQLGRLFAQSVKNLLAKAQYNAQDICAIGCHGQTLRHLSDRAYPATLQIGDPNIIAENTGITTVADFRRRDMATGGHGAPLVPAFHAAMFQTSNHDRVVLNIGGIANITLLPSDQGMPITGFDTGPGNILMDIWAKQHLHTPMDHNGQWAQSGQVDAQLLANMLQTAYFDLPPPKSTGREYFNLKWLTTLLTEHNHVSAADVQTTLCELTAHSITQAIIKFAPLAQEVLICGGGTQNFYLVDRLTILLPKLNVHSSIDLGMDPNWIEALAFAWLAKQTIEGKPGNIPTVTGAKQARVLGGIYRSGGSQNHHR